ncbi:uncharacterized protein [Macrobrachium rosenbergii]|uniref:uncharacterized protein isoform X2 n=1 Tax=Macrobrachium rosenbergii TaxID=79674 RepID=UPI0034D45794
MQGTRSCRKLIITKTQSKSSVQYILYGLNLHLSSVLESKCRDCPAQLILFSRKKSEQKRSAFAEILGANLKTPTKADAALKVLSTSPQ